MALALDVLSWVAIVGGLFFMIVGTIGVLRMPDVFTRMHAAGMTDTMGAGLLILGMCVLVYVFLMFTSPISSHAVTRAALASGVVPYTRRKEG
jgi:multicomponent Na+:H+ antiporter subunit G